jgi:hypothetical protein
MKDIDLGLVRGACTHVHLSVDEATARVVATRRKGLFPRRDGGYRATVAA